MCLHVTLGVIDPVIIAESGRFQSGERRPSEQRQSRLSRSRFSSQESVGSVETRETRERVTHSEPRVIEVSEYWPLIGQGHVILASHNGEKP